MCHIKAFNSTPLQQKFNNFIDCLNTNNINKILIEPLYELCNHLLKNTKKNVQSCIGW